MPTHRCRHRLRIGRSTRHALLTEVVDSGVGVSLIVIVGVTTAAIVASLMRKRVSA